MKAYECKAHEGKYFFELCSTYEGILINNHVKGLNTNKNNKNSLLLCDSVLFMNFEDLMKRILFTILFFISAELGSAQLPYTQNNYSTVLGESDLIYGMETNFAGISDTLKLDIYKPVGDNNCQRPLLILVHGGSWIAGSKYDSNILFMAQEMASKGYVVAAINYRLGMHKTSNYNLYWACNTSISAPCAYIADSSEIVRAIYRGMQDTKGAVRFMKERANIDSTDINNVFLAGESAGGFIVLSTAFMEEFQKPPDCFALSDAVTPDADLVACLPSGYSLTRPDLGSIEGTLHIGVTNSNINGVANFYGAMLDPTVMTGSVKKPAVYLFHQGTDVVVDYNYNRVMGRTNWECFSPTNICQPYPNTPFAYGGEALRRQLDSMGTQAPLYRADIIYNYSYMNDCFANGHAIDNVILRSLHMAELFAAVIDSNGNIPPMNCSLINVEEIDANDFLIYPNPTSGIINIHMKVKHSVQKINLIDITSKKVELTDFIQEAGRIQLRIDVNAGLYFLEIQTEEAVALKKIFFQKTQSN